MLGDFFDVFFSGTSVSIFGEAFFLFLGDDVAFFLLVKLDDLLRLEDLEEEAFFEEEVVEEEERARFRFVEAKEEEEGEGREEEDVFLFLVKEDFFVFTRVLDDDRLLFGLLLFFFTASDFKFFTLGLLSFTTSRGPVLRILGDGSFAFVFFFVVVG